MLCFDRPSAIARGLFADHALPGRVHAIQDRVDLAMAPDTTAPEFSLVLHSAGTEGAGGLVQARFRASRSRDSALAALDWAPAEILAGRLRIVLRAPVDGVEDLAQWRRATLGGREDLLAAFHTAPASAEILRALALEGGDPVAIEIELDHAGRLNGFPFVARADTIQLHDQLAAQFDSGAATAEAIEAAFLSLPDGTLRLKRTGVGADPGSEALLRETARRALASLFVRQDSEEGPVYILGDLPDAEEAAWRLDLPRVEVRRSRLRWELARLTATLATDEDRRRHFPTVRAVQPFETVEIRALNQIPLDPDHALRIRLDLAFTGRGGTEETATLEFRPGDPPLKSVTAVYPALTHPFRVASRLRLMIAPAEGQGFPTLWPADAAFEPADNPLAIDLSPARAKIELVELRAVDGVFLCCSAIRCVIRRGQRQTLARLTAGRPAAWAALTGPVPGESVTIRLEAEALAPGTSLPVVIREAAVEDRRVLITPLDVSVLEPDRVVARLASERIVFAVVDIRGAGSEHERGKVLRQGEAAEFDIWRADIFQPLAFDWRVSAVRRDDSGRTLPIETSAWERGAERHLEIAS